MQFKVTVRTHYRCSLERAFKTPMLCDVTKVHTGFLVMPRVTHCTEDADWGKPGGSKRVFVAKSLTLKGGEQAIDRVLERIENQYWKIEVCEFKALMLGFHRFVGEWKTTEVAPNDVLIEYTYILQAETPIFYPFNWLFAKTFWRVYMKRVLRNIRVMAEGEEPYFYD